MLFGIWIFAIHTCVIVRFLWLPIILAFLKLSELYPTENKTKLRVFNAQKKLDLARWAASPFERETKRVGQMGRGSMFSLLWRVRSYFYSTTSSVSKITFGHRGEVVVSSDFYRRRHIIRRTVFGLETQLVRITALKRRIEKCPNCASWFGIECLVMYKYGITDIRLFFENDICFLKQF